MRGGCDGEVWFVVSAPEAFFAGAFLGHRATPYWRVEAWVVGQKGDWRSPLLVGERRQSRPVSRFASLGRELDQQARGFVQRLGHDLVVLPAQRVPSPQKETRVRLPGRASVEVRSDVAQSSYRKSVTHRECRQSEVYTESASRLHAASLCFLSKYVP